MRYLMTFAYDGTNYSGYQVQPNKNTIQFQIEKELTKINSNNKVTIHASGRTDAHVHALNQMAHFDLDKELDCEKLKESLNKLLPSDIYIKKIKNVSDDFHARFNVVKKEYMYKINMGEYNPIEQNYVYQYNKKLNVEEMTKALEYIKGEHDFKSFTKLDEGKDTVRTIYDATIEVDKNIMIITLAGSGFLRYMVRNIVGTLIEIGSGKRKSSDIKTILDSKDRKEAGITANANGLYLKKVEY